MADQDRLERLRQLAEQDPNNELAQFSLGSHLLERGDVRGATACLQKALALNPRNSKAYQLLGEAQRQSGDARLAVETLTNGYRVAKRQGDMMPMKAIAEMLQNLGAEVPSAGQERVVAGAAAGAADGFKCRRCGGCGPPLKQRPFKGPLGEQILACVCQACWSEWVRMGTRVINELRLPMHDPRSQETYDLHMKEFLALE